MISSSEIALEASRRDCLKASSTCMSKDFWLLAAVFGLLCGIGPRSGMLFAVTASRIDLLMAASILGSNVLCCLKYAFAASIHSGEKEVATSSRDLRSASSTSLSNVLFFFFLSKVFKFYKNLH